MKCKCSEGICKKAKESYYYCGRMNEKGIFETYPSYTPSQFHCYWANKEVIWIEYNLEYIMKEIIKEHEENNEI